MGRSRPDEAPTPSPAATNPDGELHELLIALFSAGEFRRWLTNDLGEKIEAELPGENAPPAEQMTAAIEALERRGHLGERFFRELVSARPDRRAEIERVCWLWLTSRPPGVVPSLAHRLGFWGALLLLTGLVAFVVEYLMPRFPSLVIALGVVCILLGLDYLHRRRAKEGAVSSGLGAYLVHEGWGMKLLVVGGGIAVGDALADRVRGDSPPEPEHTSSRRSPTPRREGTRRDRMPETPQVAPSPREDEDEDRPKPPKIATTQPADHSLPARRETRCPPDMALIRGGSFNGHDIDDTCMDLTEVTVAAYQRCVQSKACTEPDEMERCNWGEHDRGEHPVNCVDWHQAVAYCEAGGRRLPTEWEWEWAARGRDEGRQYPWGDDAPTCERAVMREGTINGCGRGSTWPVGSKPAGQSTENLQDLAGNVWEWTSSADGKMRVLRGGGWANASPETLSASVRDFSHPSYRGLDDGFRCAGTAR